MASPQKYCVIDFETRSRIDLKLTGAYEYARHPSTKLLCVAWQYGTRDELKTAPVRSWSPALPSSYGELKRALLDPGVTLVAHNAFFEQVITRFVLSRLISDEELRAIEPERWLCTASLARALALPGKLAEACAALKLPFQKDMIGHKLMLKMSKPRRATKTDSSPWHAKTADLLRLIDYCESDVRAETALLLRLPPLSDVERKVWLLDQKINWRGFRTDRPLVKRVLNLIEKASLGFVEETCVITNGEVLSTNQRDATLKWVRARGVEIPDLRAKTVADLLLKGVADDPARRLLEVRANSSKTSTAKYEAFEYRSRSDGRVRDNLVYHTASTGRWGGSGVQPQNFPRPAWSDNLIKLALKIITEDAP